MVIRSAQVRAALQRTVPPLLVLLSAAIIIVGKADQSMFTSLRTAIADDVAPGLDALSQPVSIASAAVDRVSGFFSTYQDNVRLKQENERLLQWQQAAMKLSADNRDLRGLLKVIPENAVSYVTARIIADSGGGYVRTVMINAGGDQGVARGQAVITGSGLVGRTTEVGSRAARVLLITDLNSRIPAVVERSHANAVLAGDNSDRPRLLYAHDPDSLKIGDRIVTSGEGGVFPPGLPIGVITGLESGSARVEPFVNMSRMDYLLVVDYGLSRALPQPVPVSAKAARRGRAVSADAGLR